MAKRLTATNKWDKAWFRRLPPRHKALWQFLVDKCDQAGMWEIDFDSASHFINDSTPITENDLKVFGDRVERFSNDKLWIVGFVDFQCGELSHKSPAHKPVFKLLTKYKLLDRVLHRLSNRVQEIEKEIEKEEEGEKEIPASKIENKDFKYEFKPGEDEELKDFEDWTQSVLDGNDVYFVNMVRNANIQLNGQLERLARDHLGKAARYQWHKKSTTQQAFRHSLINFISENINKQPNGNSIKGISGQSGPEAGKDYRGGF